MSQPCQQHHVKVINGNQSTYDIAKGDGTIMRFNVRAEFSNWITQNNKDYARSIEVELFNVSFGDLYRLSKVRFCSDCNVFEIHVEKISNPAGVKLAYEYRNAINERFDLTGDSNGNCGDDRQVMIIIYNNDPSHEDNFYNTCCEYDPPVASNEPLDYPHDESAKDDKGNLEGLKSGFNPDTANGNILVGKKQ
ncbi:hypothetical protein [Gilvibacter sp.]|uniref:hypothetical protein n=1 Tax=Gilvibacter sp. TaxID=2729997 RepID=UPI003F4A6E40